MRRHNIAVGLVGLAALLAACGSGGGGDLPLLPGAQGAGNGREMAASADSASTSMMVANVRYELADGVSTDAKEAQAYSFANTSKTAVEKLAKAFGMTDEVRQDGAAWTIGGDGKDAYLYVSRSGGVFSMSVNSYGSGSSGCSVEPAAPDAPVDSETRCTPTPTTVPANAPTPAGAKKVATDALKSAGVDLDGAKVTTETSDGATQNVRFQHSVGGAVVEGYETYVAVGPDDKIVSASGYLESPNSVGSYELATLTRAVERLNASYGQATTLDARDDSAVSPADGAAEAPAVGAADQPLVDPMMEEPPRSNPEPTVVTLTGVKLGLLMQSDSEGDLWLVPAYRFDTQDDNVVSAPAAADKYIEQPKTDTSVPTDGGATEPGGTSPGGDASCAAVEGDITAQVCASAVNVKVGEPVVFRVTATDADRAFATGPCFDGLTAVYGDDAGGDVRCEACSTDVAQGPGKMGAERSHTYEKAGTYTATFTIKSGADCGQAHPNDSKADVSLTIKVA